jgi:hypothetical protein
MAKKNSGVAPAATAPEQVIETPAVEIEQPKAETPKAPVTKQTPVELRKYRSIGGKDNTVAPIVFGFKGKQRQIVVAALNEFTMSEAGGATIKDITAVVKSQLIAKGGVEPSVRYHLHHLALLGYAEVINPTFTV